MIRFVTGPKDSGKTGELSEIHSQAGGSGVITRKGYHEGVHSYYHLVFLSEGKSAGDFSGQTVLLNWDSSLIDPAQVETCGELTTAETFSFGRWIFSRDSFNTGCRWMREVIAYEESPLYLDEIGALELEGGGFAPILPELFSHSGDIYIGCRDKFLRGFIGKYQLKDVTIVDRIDSGQRNNYGKSIN